MAFTDIFTAVNGTDLPTYNAAWVTLPGSSTCEVQNNSVVGTIAAAFNANYYNGTFAEAHYAKGVFHTSLDIGAGVIVRAQSGANSYYYALWDTGTSKVFTGQMVAGVATDWDTGQVGFAAGNTIELRIDASTPTTVYLYKNTTTLVATYTSKSALSGGRAGVACYTSANFGLDSWEGGDVTAAGTALPILGQLYRRYRGGPGVRYG